MVNWVCYASFMPALGGSSNQVCQVLWTKNDKLPVEICQIASKNSKQERNRPNAICFELSSMLLQNQTNNNCVRTNK